MHPHRKHAADWPTSIPSHSLPRDWKDRVSREITGPFVKCKIRNASPQKWNKPRHTQGVGGVENVDGGGGGGGAAEAALATAVAAAAAHQQKRGCKGREGNPLRVRLCVSFISTDIIIALRGRARNFTYVRTFVPSRYNIRT